MSSKPRNGKEKLEVMLFTQSYREAKESRIVKQLEPIGIVTGSYTCDKSENPFDDDNIFMVNNSMEENASKMLADYIFGIDYKIHGSKYDYYILVTGDAYRRQKKPKA